MTNTLVSIFAFGVLVALHEAGHFWAARWMGIGVLKYSIGLLSPLWSWTSKKTGTKFQLGIVPFGGFVQVKAENPYDENEESEPEPDSYYARAPWRRLIFVIAGPLANLLIAWVLFVVLFMAGFPMLAPVIGEPQEGRPAAEAGLVSGDKIIAIDQAAVSTWNEAASIINKHPGQSLAFTIKRGGDELIVDVVPEVTPTGGLVGIRPLPETNIVTLPFGSSLGAAAAECGSILKNSLVAVGNLVTGAGGEVAGPVKIVQAASSLLERSWRDFLGLIGNLSLMLFLFNLLPIPALDGGRALFLSYEFVTKKPPSRKVEMWIHAVGFFLILGLIGLVTIKEVIELF